VPGSAILEKAVDAAYERRLRSARDVLIETIRHEGVESLAFSKDNADDLIQMMMRFAKAAQEGAARKNLKLLSEVIVGLKKNDDFRFDKFQLCANVLETLTKDEILFIGYMFSYYKKSTSNNFRAFLTSLSGTFNEQQGEALAAGLLRTGMLFPVSAWGTLSYSPTPRLFEICELAQIELHSQD
jgi:hypothetical protein